MSETVTELLPPPLPEISVSLIQLVPLYFNTCPLVGLVILTLDNPSRVIISGADSQLLPLYFNICPLTAPTVDTSVRFANVLCVRSVKLPVVATVARDGLFKINDGFELSCSAQSDLNCAKCCVVGSLTQLVPFQRNISSVCRLVRTGSR